MNPNKIFAWAKFRPEFQRTPQGTGTWENKFWSNRSRDIAIRKFKKMIKGFHAAGRIWQGKIYDSDGKTILFEYPEGDMKYDYENQAENG